MNKLYNQKNTAQGEKRSSILSSNPVMRRLNKVDEYSEANASSYGGITIKTVYFLLFTVVGIILQLVFAASLASGEIIQMEYKGFEFSLYTSEAAALGGAVVAAIVFQLLAFFAKPIVPVTGALYCVTQGYILSFLIFKVLKDYEYLGVLALAITMLIILVMAILYSTGVIKVTKNSRWLC